MRASAQDDALGHPVQVLSAPPVNVEKREEVQQQQEQDQTKRQTLAERMAKLGGIKFGTAPIPAVSRPPPTVTGVDEEGGSHPRPEDEEQPVEPSEEEEERARKERIAAKLAGMGGMRIGMMPMGMGPQRAYTLRDENVAPPSPTRAVPLPIRPPPPVLAQTQDTDSERISDDGVKVEAEESEMEEVDYADVAQELEEAPPVPIRGRRRGSTDKTTSPPRPLVPGIRPPVPVTRRASMQTSKSTGSVEFGSRPTSFQVFPQSEYVIVDEPQSHEEGTPPSRRTSRINPIRPLRTPTRASQTFDSRSISSHWELPSIPTAAIDFGSGADLSLSSWTDAGELTSPSVSSPPRPPPPAKEPAHKPRPSELQLSADELMTMWGRVGVQVCEVATSLFENSKKTLIGDGSYAGFITTVLAGVPNAAPISAASGEYGYLVYAQNGTSVQKRVSEIMPGDIVEIHEGKLKGHKGIQTYHQNVGGSGEALLGIVGEFEAKKSKIRVFHANQHVGQQVCFGLFFV
jgi:myosin tail region-interacting protein MTI1